MQFSNEWNHSSGICAAVDTINSRKRFLSRGKNRFSRRCVSNKTRVWLSHENLSTLSKLLKERPYLPDLKIHRGSHWVPSEHICRLCSFLEDAGIGILLLFLTAELNCSCTGSSIPEYKEIQCFTAVSTASYETQPSDFRTYGERVLIKTSAPTMLHRVVALPCFYRKERRRFTVIIFEMMPKTFSG